MDRSVLLEVETLRRANVARLREKYREVGSYLNMRLIARRRHLLYCGRQRGPTETNNVTETRRKDCRDYRRQ
jgi:hypothetical protein